MQPELLLCEHNVNEHASGPTLAACIPIHACAALPPFLWSAVRRSTLQLPSRPSICGIKGVNNFMAILHYTPLCASPLTLCRSGEDTRRWRCSAPLSRHCSFLGRTRKGYGGILTAFAQGENSESVSGKLTEEEALSVLGVSKNTKFDDIVKIKNRLLTAPNLNKEAIKEVITTYLPGTECIQCVD